ncbi:MAG: ABC transporter permease [Bacteroidota bacterium]
MIRNYIKISFRNLRKNKLYTTLNIVGLAVGLAGSILVLLYIADETSYDKFHPNLANIYLMLQHQKQGGVTYTFESTPGPLAAALRTEIPEIKTVFRYSWREQHLMTVGEKSTYEKGYYAEPDLFKVLHFQVIEGDPVAALADAGSVVITERAAKKLFGNENPMGKILRHNNKENLKVAAVVADVPENSTMKFDVMLPFRLYELENKNWINSSWGSNSLPTWMELQPGTDVAALNRKLEQFIQAKEPEASAHVFAYSLADWHLHNKFSEGKPSGGRIDILLLLSIIGGFILLIACINFMNLATARSERRAREVGVRKVVGAQRSLIIGQFLSEALVMTFFAMILGILLVKLALPGFNLLTEKTLVFNFSNWQIWAALPLLGLLTGLIAGSYPAFYLSSFQPIRVLKGVINSGKSGGRLRKGLVVFQFVISIVLIFSTIVIFSQLKYVQARPLGYDQENLIEIPARGSMQESYEVLKNDLTQIPGVKAVSASNDDLISYGSNTAGIEWPGKTKDQDFLVTVSRVKYDFTKTAGLKLVEGRDFSPEYGADTMACLINETAVRQMGLKQPVVGTQLTWDTTRTIVGVVQDYVFNDPFFKPAPMLFALTSDPLGHFFVRFQDDHNWQQTLSQIEAAVKKSNPNHPFEFHFTKDEYQKNFDGIRTTGRMVNTFGGLAIFISCLGLFGLSAFVAERRKKEIGIRKVLGATIGSLWFFLSQDFLRPVFYAFIIAAPLAAYAMEKLLSRFEYRISLSWWMFLLAGVAAIVIATLTVSYQGVKAALADPVKSLRTE